MNPNDINERELQTVWANQVGKLVPKLDVRLARRLGPHVQAPRINVLGRLLLRPAMGFAAIALALSFGFYIGTQQRTMGPHAFYTSEPVLVQHSKEPGAVALLKVVDGTALDQYQSRLSTSNAQKIPPMAAAQEDTAAPAESSVTNDTSGSAGAATTYLALQTQAQVLARAADGRQWREWVASIGMLQQDLITAIGHSVVRLKADGAWETIGSALQRPIGAAVDVFGRVFVTEHLADGSLIAFSNDGKQTTIRSGLNYPAGIAFAPDRSLYLAEQGRGRVLRFVPLDGHILPESQVEVFAAGFAGQFDASAPLDDPTRHGGPFALAINPKNELMVSDHFDGTTAIYRFELGAVSNWWDVLFKAN